MGKQGKKNRRKPLVRPATVVGSSTAQFSNSGYGDWGASRVRRSFKGYRATSLSPRSDIDANNQTLRERARTLYMSAPLATSAIKCLRTSVVGPGLHLHAKVDQKTLGITDEEAASLNNEIEAEFELWAADKRSVDVCGLNDFYALQQLALLSWKLSGDAFVLIEQGNTDRLHPYSLRLRLIEADRISTPGTNVTFFTTEGKNNHNGNTIYDGVEINERGTIIAYHVRNTYPREIETKKTNWVRIEAVGKLTGLPNILHLMESERADQYRGVTCLAPVLESVLQIGRYLSSEEAAALIESFFTAYITMKSPDGQPSTARPTHYGDDGEPDSDYERDPADYEMGAGEVRILEPGEDITTVTPQRPNTQFDAFITSVATQVGAAIEVPVDVLLKRYNSSYSASRAALVDYWNGVRMNREWFTSDFNDPVYEIWLSEAVARGRIQAPGFFSDPRIRAAYLRHEWNGPTMPHLDPVKEVDAMARACKEGFMTRTQATTRLNGGDFMQNMADLVKEAEALAPIMMLLAEAIQIKQESEKKQPEKNEDNQ